MIFDAARNIDQYFDESSDIFKAVDFVVNFDRSQPDGVYEIDGEDIFAIVQSVETEPAEQRRFESHRKFIDVQMVLDGQEIHDVTILNDDIRITQEYDEEKDVMFFEVDNNCCSVAMTDGMFVVYGPQDGHKPCCCVDKPEKIRKICVKIKI